MTAISPDIPSPGAILAGRYRVERVLGAGGMGVVLAVHHLELGSLLAMKLLRPSVLEGAGAIERFLREARAATAIQSDHVTRVMDFGRLESGVPFMVMELLCGEDLAQRLARVRTVSVTAAVDMVLQAGEALAEAHALGIVHRDLKPANLFLHHRRDGSETVKILDFGISKVTSPMELNLTSTTSIIGSPLYMSPEQLRSARTVDARSDIWALGVVLYEATVGRPPFMASTLAELAVVITNEQPPPMVQVPARFAVVVQRCLSKRPEQRFSDVGALARALSPFASASQLPSVQRIGRVLAMPVAATVPSAALPNGDPAVERAQSTTSTSVAEARLPSRGRTTLLAAGAGFALASVALFVGMRLQTSSSTGQRTVAGSSALPALEPSVAAPPSMAELPPLNAPMMPPNPVAPDAYAARDADLAASLQDAAAKSPISRGTREHADSGPAFMPRAPTTSRASATATTKPSPSASATQVLPPPPRLPAAAVGLTPMP